MHTRLLPLLLLAVHASLLSAQGTRDKAALDTITIASSSSTPIRVQIRNTGAYATVVGMQGIAADTLTFSTPVTLILPRERFALAIVALPATGEARITLLTNRNLAPNAGRFRTTFSTPVSLERTEDDAPLTAQARTMRSERVP